MRCIHSVRAMQIWALRQRDLQRKVVLVPTMGALHAGHLSLIMEARRRGDLVVVSIYVNPTQFGPKEDLTRYPRPRLQDLQLCRKAGVDIVFAPPNLYGLDHSTWVMEQEQSKGRCGTSRPNHFRGVATVVLKLFNLVQPSVALFGQKDAQQVDVIRRMVRDLDVPVKIIALPTIREKDGLALSSRNVFLSIKERETAVALPLLLHAAVGQARPAVWLRSELTKRKGIRLDYVEAVNGRLCAALWVGRTRLIDNVSLK